MGPSDSPQLREVLAQGRELGFLGPGSLETHIEHARGFASAFEVLGKRFPERVLDLGSGGGIPGLALLGVWPAAHFALLDGSERRGEFLNWAVEELKVADRLVVLIGRAEELAHTVSLRGAFDLVVARSFGPPGVLAECSAGFLEPDGALVVSEPPEETVEARWPTKGIAQVGFGPALGVEEGSHYAVMRLTGICPERFPRRVGVPTKRPLF